MYEAPMSAFPTTRWTLILAAKSSPEARREALEQLMRAYWRPLFVFFRKKGLDDGAAQDAVQELLAQVIERDAMSKLSPERGRLRAYLRTMAGHLLINGYERGSAAKRGAGGIHVELDDRLSAQLSDDAAESADQAFDRAWAQSLMNQALARLKAEFDSGVRVGPFEVLTQVFGAASSPPSYKVLSAQHGMSLPQLKAFVHRSRARYQVLVREAVVDTVGDSVEAEAELASVLEALGAS